LPSNGNHRAERDGAGAELRLRAAVDVHPVQRALAVTLGYKHNRPAVWRHQWFFIGRLTVGQL
jgi:hypothetical protein